MSKNIRFIKKIDFEEVNWYALRAKAAYTNEKDIKQAFPQTVRVATVPDTDVSYFLEIFPESRLQVLTVRGTANLKNALEDSEYAQSKNGKLGIYVHHGFDVDTTKIYNDMAPYLKKEYAVKITGHSLGAAISTLLMMYLHKDGYQVEKSINFGQPKVTNKAGVKAYNFLPLTRVVDENDVVPLLPPITLLDSIHGIYEHLGAEVILLKNTDYVYLETHDAARKSVGNFWKDLGQESIKEHFMDTYLKNIKDKLEDSTQIPYGDREQYIP
ncbi:MAG: lipase family protein [Nitrospirales bacterium]